MTDAFNNSSTCQRVIYVKNAAIYQVECPAFTIVNCINGVLNINPENTGYPFIKNVGSIQNSACFIDTRYSDVKTTAANNPNMIMIERTWTIINRCTQEQQTCKQQITVNACANTPLVSLSGGINRENGENITAMVKLLNPNDSINAIESSNYQFAEVPVGGSYRIRPERDNDVSNGVTTFDIALISKHVLDIQPFTSPYQIIAADVNRDGSIDATDMVLIRNLILKRITRFPSNNSWRFIPKSYVFNDVKNPFAEDFPEMLIYNDLNTSMSKGDFMAIKVGDVNSTAKADLNAVTVRGSKPIENIFLIDKKMEAGKEYIFDLNIKNSSLKALQLALKIDNSKVNSFSAETGNLPQFESGNFEVNPKQETIGMAWANTKKGGLSNENSVIQLKITPRQTVWLHEIVSLDEDGMDNLAYDTEGGIEKQIQLQFNAVKTDDIDFELHQNRPNPFITETLISFVLPETNGATLSIYDVNGREVYTLKQNFNKGYNELKLDKTVLKNSGIYFYRLQSDKFTAVKRLQFFVN